MTFDAGQLFPWVMAGVVLLVCLGSCVAWIPAAREDPAGALARSFVAVGVIAMILDFGRLGSVLGLALAAMGSLIMWAGQPAPEVPRPRRRGVVAAAVVTGVATYAALAGWGPFGRLPEEVRAVVALVVGAAGVLATFAVADRARVTLRAAIARRFADNG